MSPGSPGTSPTSTPTSIPTPAPTPTPTPTPTDEGASPAPPDESTAAPGAASDEAILAETDTGAGQLLSTAAPIGLSDPYSSAQDGWNVGPQEVDPYTAGAAANGVLAPYVGQDVDPYTNAAAAGANSNPFTGGQDVNPFTGAQGNLLSSPDLLASNGPIPASTSAVTTQYAPTTILSGQTPVDTVTIDGNKYAHYQVVIDGVTYDAYMNDKLLPGQVRLEPAPPAAPPAATPSPAPQPAPQPAPAAPPNPAPAPPVAGPATQTPSAPYNPMADSPLASWLLYGGNTPILDFFTNDRHLQTAQNFALGVATGAAAIATGGLLLDAAPALFGGITASASSASAASAAAPIVAGAAGVAATNPQLPEELAEEVGSTLPALGPVIESALPSEAPELSNLAQQLAQNYSSGSAFQTAVTQAFGLARNTTTMLGQTTLGSLRATIVDVYAEGQTPMADVKDVLRLSFTSQLQAQASVASVTNTSFNIITSVRNLSVSGPLADAVQASGGFIFKVDLSAMTVEVWDAANGAWIPFLGGSWGF